MDKTLRALADRAEITDLMDRYLLSLAERTFDESWARSMFTEDVRSETPVGNQEGREQVMAGTRVAIERFERTQHVGANYVIDLDGDRATVRANAIMTDLNPAGRAPGTRFVVGGTVDSQLARTS